MEETMKAGAGRTLPATYQIEFIRYVDGRADPDVLHVVDGVFPGLEDAVMKGNLLFGMIDETPRRARLPRGPERRGDCGA